MPETQPDPAIAYLWSGDTYCPPCATDEHIPSGGRIFYLSTLSRLSARDTCYSCGITIVDHQN